MPTWSNRSVEEYIGLLADSDTRLRLQAVAALAVLGDRRAVPLLIERLTADEDVSVGARAAEALGRLGAIDAVVYLLAAVCEKEVTDSRVVASAAEALQRLGDIRAMHLLMQDLSPDDATLTPTVVAAIGQFPETIIPSTIEALRHGSPALRWAAILALILTRVPSAAAALQDTLQDEDKRVREQAAWGIAMLRFWEHE
ncbi:MAG: HEAT repeat domain-containing protein [Ktedonobacterales bacterium]